MQQRIAGRKGAVQPPCGHQDHKCCRWLEMEKHHGWRAKTQGHASMIAELMPWLPMLMTPQKIKKPKTHPTEQIIRFITQSSFLTHFLPPSFFILKLWSPFPTAFFALQTLQHCKAVQLEPLVYLLPVQQPCFGAPVLGQVPRRARKRASKLPFLPQEQITARFLMAPRIHPHAG